MRDMTDGEIKTLLFEEVESLRAENEKLQRVCDQITKSSPMNTAHELDRLRARVAELEAIPKQIKDSLDYRLNEYLCEMKEGYDDSIVGFNEAWDVMRKVFAALLSPPSSKGEGE